MPEFKIGDMWQAPPPDIYCVTTNACLNAAGHLVMGRGVALQAATRYPGLAEEFGKQLVFEPGKNVAEDYYLLIPDLVIKPMLLGVQTKRHWLTKADLSLIQKSLAFLCAYILGWTDGAGKLPQVYLPYPGVGNGKLTKMEVYPLLKDLPQNITIWSL